MKKLLVFFMTMTLVVTCFTACGKEKPITDKDLAGDPIAEEDLLNLAGQGLDEVIELPLSKDYAVAEGDDLVDDYGKLLARYYNNGKTTVYMMVMAYNGQAVNGPEENFKEWRETHYQEFADKLEVKGPDTEICIYPIGLKVKDNEEFSGEINAVFGYKDYMIMVGMYNNEGGALTKEQRQEFYDILKGIKYK